MYLPLNTVLLLDCTLDCFWGLINFPNSHNGSQAFLLHYVGTVPLDCTLIVKLNYYDTGSVKLTQVINDGSLG